MANLEVKLAKGILKSFAVSETGFDVSCGHCGESGLDSVEDIQHEPNCIVLLAIGILTPPCVHNWHDVFKGDNVTGQRCMDCKEQEWF